MYLQIRVPYIFSSQFLVRIALDEGDGAGPAGILPPAGEEGVTGIGSSPKRASVATLEEVCRWLSLAVSV
jgi:hypothetical protein